MNKIQFTIFPKRLCFLSIAEAKEKYYQAPMNNTKISSGVREGVEKNQTFVC